MITLLPPLFCRPIEFGANVVIHSTSKYLDGHAIALGGSITDGGNFNWNNGKYPQLSTPDQTYHGLVYTETFGPAAYIVKARVQLMRDLGATPAPQNSFLLNVGMETLALRMQRHYEKCTSCSRVFRKTSAKSLKVNYPGLPSSPRLCPQTKILTERFVWRYFL